MVLYTNYRSILPSDLSTDQVGLSNINPHLNFRFLFFLINGLIDDKIYPKKCTSDTPKKWCQV
jgi:hypothetical protein